MNTTELQITRALSSLKSLVSSASYNTAFINGSSNSTQKPKDLECNLDEESTRIILITVYSLIFVFGLLGNVLALYVFLCIHSKKSSVHVFLINTSVADLILIFCLPFRIYYHINHNKWMLGQTFCKVVGNVFYMNMYVSIFLLTFISIDRYFKVHHSTHQHKLLNIKFSYLICCITWMLSIALIIPFIIKPEGNESNQKCFHYKDKQQDVWEAIINIIIVAFFWLLFLFLVTSYVKIARTLIHLSREKSTFPNASKYRKTAKKSFIVLFIFTLCFVPYHLFRCFYIHSQISSSKCDWKQIMDKTNEIVLLFSALNSCLDPVMYFLLSSSIRKRTFSIIFKKKPHNISTTNSSTTEMKQINVSIPSNPRVSFSSIYSIFRKQSK
ncbi:probable G-protein coupled receptor 34 [Polypterus senegalus]|uniref:probable G-protein coupled receptor 34 n=1 Tax=Polypterus senegalus TaxID=55291 RepID=UPI00196356B9|nr:probable G-protein coupled receptor 34 [Polypterus senegalus]